MTTINIYTFNVQFYRDKHPGDVFAFIKKNASAHKIDVICLQEHDISIPMELTSLPNEGSWDEKQKSKHTHYQIPGYKLAAYCITGEKHLRAGFFGDKYKRFSNNVLANCILVKEDLLVQDKINNIKIDSKCTAPRSGCMVKVKDMWIACVHLCGGRYDDEEFSKISKDDKLLPEEKYSKLQELIDERDNELTRLYKVQNFDIITGDFNSYETKEIAKTHLIKAAYSGYINLLSDDIKDKYTQYASSGHNALVKLKLNRSYTYSDESGDNKINQTSYYGNVVDWVYHNNTKLRVDTVFQITSLDFSDHNGVIVYFKINEQPTFKNKYLKYKNKYLNLKFCKKIIQL
jgi:hypothetical protein